MGAEVEEARYNVRADPDVRFEPRRILHWGIYAFTTAQRCIECINLRTSLLSCCRRDESIIDWIKPQEARRRKVPPHPPLKPMIRVWCLETPTATLRPRVACCRIAIAIVTVHASFNPPSHPTHIILRVDKYHQSLKATL